MSAKIIYTSKSAAAYVTKEDLRYLLRNGTITLQVYNGGERCEGLAAVLHLPSDTLHFLKRAYLQEHQALYMNKPRKRKQSGN